MPPSEDANADSAWVSDPNADPDLTALRILSDRLAAAIDRIGEADWTLATPCADWNLAGLVDHVTGGNWFTCALLDGERAEEAMNRAIGRFSDGSATREQASLAVREQFDAFTAPGVLDRTWDHIAGEMTGRRILRIRLQDLIVHCWDIEQARTPPASVPPELARWGLAELADPESRTAQLFGLTGVAAVLADVHTAADPSDLYLNILGRGRAD